MRWETGISTGIAYQHPIEDVLEPIRSNGFRVIEVATARSHIDIRDAARLVRIRRRAEELGLRVCSLHAPFGHDIDVTDPDPDFRRHSLETLVHAADALVTLGGRLYVVHPGGEDHHWAWERDQRLHRSVEALRRLWEACRDRGLTLVVETPLPHLLGGRLEDLDWILSELPLEGTAVCVDTSHCALGRNLYEAIRRFAGRLEHVQASDNHGTADDHLPPGDGMIEWGEVTRTLAEVGYAGVFLLEVTGNGDAGMHLRRTAKSFRETLPELWPAGPVGVGVGP